MGITILFFLLVSTLNALPSQFAFRFDPSSQTNPLKFAHEHGYTVLKQGLSWDESVWVFERDEKTHTAHSSRRDPNNLGYLDSIANTTETILWAERQVFRTHSKRTRTLLDPLWEKQWTLHANARTYVVETWDIEGVTGAGHQIAIVDDGLERGHPDLEPKYSHQGSWDFNDGDSSPSPFESDWHGTACAGVAAAIADNNVCVAGVAPNATIAGIRLIARPTTDTTESEALLYKNDINDIYSCSWGPSDDGKHLIGPGTLVKRALEHSVDSGRGGLGSIYVWASGNGHHNQDSCAYDGYASSRFTIAVGAVNPELEPSYYSESCAALLLSAPSSGTDIRVPSTDLLASRGDSSNECTTNFGGTSSAAPYVAGVIALILEARPSLTWRDIQGILVHSSQIPRNLVNDTDIIVNNAGLLYHNRIGFGVVDAKRAVMIARDWDSYDSSDTIQHAYHSGSIVVNLPIQDARSTESATITNINIDSMLVIEHVEVTVDIYHPSRGDLEILIKSPSGTISRLAAPHRDSGSNYEDWTFTSVMFWDERSRGEWTLDIVDTKRGNQGTFVSWKLSIYGRA